MPIYEYSCNQCNKVTEKISNSTQKNIQCPDCGGHADRIVSIFSGKIDSSVSPSAGCLPGSGFT